ncbi:MAG: hypothetical protein ABJE47_15885 [bacterium]
MKHFSLVIVGIAALATVSACGTESTAPSQSIVAPSVLASKGGLTVQTLGTTVTTVIGDITSQSWNTPLAAPITVTARVSKTQGGVLGIPSLGITVTIPAGATDTTVTISMTALAGNLVALDFQPSGTKFKQPLHVTQDLGFTQWSGALFDVIYFKSSDDIDRSSKKIKVSEVIPVIMLGKTASFDIWHFSGYAVAAGRSSLDEM